MTSLMEKIDDSMALGQQRPNIGEDINRNHITQTASTSTSINPNCGNFGIGTTNSLFTLSTANGGTIAGSTLRLQNGYLENGGKGIQLTGVDNGINGPDLRIQGRTAIFGTFSDLVTVKNSGAVGIRTTAPPTFA